MLTSLPGGILPSGHPKISSAILSLPDSPGDWLWNKTATFFWVSSLLASPRFWTCETFTTAWNDSLKWKELNKKLKEKRNRTNQFSLVQFSHSVVSDSLWPHESQHARPPCPSPSPGVHSDSHPSSLGCHPAISSSVVPFFSCPQSSQHQSLFQWVNSSHEVAKVLELQL